MKVKELLEILKDLDPEMELIVQKDSEGNGYSPLAGADSDAIYVAKTTWYGEVYEVDLTPEDCCMDQEEWEEMQKLPRTVILYPMY